MAVSPPSTSSTANNTNTAYVQVVLKPDRAHSKEFSTSAVKRAEVEDNDRLIDRATVILDDDPQGSIAGLLKERLILRIDMGWGTEPATLFEGVVIKVSTTSENGVREVTMVALDFSYRMMLGAPVSKNHPPGKLSKIITDIVNLYKIPVGQIAIDHEPTFDDQKPLKQIMQKDWEFIQSLARIYKARAYVEYNDGESRFYFHPESKLLQGNSMGTLTYCAGFHQLINFKFQRITNGADPLSSVSTLDKDTGATVKSPEPPAKPPDKPAAPDPDKSAALAEISPQEAQTYEDAQNALSKVIELDQRPKDKTLTVSSDPEDLKRIVRQDPTRILGFFGEGEMVGTVKMRAKGKVTIQGISTWAEGDWYVRKAVHIYTRDIKEKKDRSTYHTKFVVTR